MAPGFVSLRVACQQSTGHLHWLQAGISVLLLHCLHEGCISSTVLSSLAITLGALSYTAILASSITYPLLCKLFSTRHIIVHACAQVCDIAAIVEIAHAAGALVCVDNSFLTPLYQRPLQLGADISMTSGTKYIGGHGDTTLGMLAVRDPELGQQLYFLQNSEGAGLAPMDCWLALRGLKTVSFSQMSFSAEGVVCGGFVCVGVCPCKSDAAGGLHVIPCLCSAHTTGDSHHAAEEAYVMVAAGMTGCRVSSCMLLAQSMPFCWGGGHTHMSPCKEAMLLLPLWH